MADRFYKTAAPERIDFVSELPIGMMMKAQQVADQAIDSQRAGLDLSSQFLNINALDAEKEAAQQWKAQRSQQIDDLAKNIQQNPQNWRQYQWAVRDLSKDIQNDLTTGPAANIVKNYNQYQLMKKNLDEQVDLNLKNPNQGVAPFQRDSLMKAALNNYKSTGESGNPYTFTPIEAAAYVNPNEVLKNLKNNLKADSIEQVQDNVTGQWIWRNTQTGEELSPDKVIGAATGLLSADDRLNAFLKQGSQYGWSKPFTDAQGNAIPLKNSNGQINPEHPYAAPILGVLGNAYIDRKVANTQMGENPSFTRQQESIYREVGKQLDEERDNAAAARDQQNAIELENIKAANAERLARLKGQLKNTPAKPGTSTNNPATASDITKNSTTQVTQNLFTDQEKDINYLRSNIIPAVSSQLNEKVNQLNNSTDPIEREKLTAEINGLNLQKNVALSFHNAVTNDVMNSPEFKGMSADDKQAFSSYQIYLINNANNGKSLVDNESLRKQWIAKNYSLDLSGRSQSMPGAWATADLFKGPVGAKNEGDYRKYQHINAVLTKGADIASKYASKQTEANKVVIDGINIASNTEAYKLLDQALKTGNIETMNPGIFAGRTTSTGTNPAKQDFQVDQNSFFENSGDRYSLSNIKKYMQSVGANDLRDIASNVRVIPNTGDGIQLEVTLRDKTLQGKKQGSSAFNKVQIEGLQGNKVTFNISGTSLRSSIIQNLLKDEDINVREKAQYMGDVDALNLQNRLSSLQFYIPQNSNGWSNVQSVKYGNDEFWIRKNQNEIYDVTLSNGTKASFPDAQSMRRAIIDYHKSNQK